MFGTVARARIKPENRQKFVDVITNPEYAQVPGFVHGFVLLPEGKDDEVVLVAMFEDRDAYFRNAEDPAQHERYTEYRALLEEDPQWTDGEWFGRTQDT